MALPESDTSWFRDDHGIVAAFATRSHTDGARLGAAIAGLEPDADIDVRAATVRVRLLGGSGEPATRTAQIAQLAAASTMPAEPEAAREFSVVVETTAPTAVARFWSEVLGYRQSPNALSDPLRRRPAMLLRETGEPAGPPSWMHLDVSRPGGPSADDAPALGGQFVGGAFGVCAADPEGNLADIIPAGACSDDPAVSAWHGGFSAQAAWRAASAEQAAGFAATVAGLADAADLQIAIDRRADLVVVDSGKDGWETQPGFPDFAGDVQAAATREHLSAVTTGLGFVQAFISAESVTGIRPFWMQALSYLEDPRSDVLDIVDPRGLGPVVAFQDVDEPPERATRDRFHLRLSLPAPAAADVLGRAQAIPGGVRRKGSEWWEISDAEGNTLDVVALPEVDLPEG